MGESFTHSIPQKDYVNMTTIHEFERTAGLEQANLDPFTNENGMVHASHVPALLDDQGRAVAYPTRGQNLVEEADVLRFMMEHPDETPYHIQKLEELDRSDNEKEAILSMYTGTEPRPFSNYTNKVVTIQGAAILFIPPFKDTEGVYQEGFYKVFLLTANKDEDGNPVLVSTSSKSVGQHMMYAMRKRGWYVWEEPVRYRFTVGANNSHHIRNVEEELRASEGKGKK